MSTIWKFRLDITDVQAIEMPAGARILSLGLQLNSPTIWAVVNPYASRGYRRFRVYGTGYPFVSTAAQFIGTVQNGGLVWHVFDYGEIS